MANGCGPIYTAFFFFATQYTTQNTAPPMINTLSSSLLTHCTSLFAASARAARDVVAGAIAYSSNSGVIHASVMQVAWVEWWILDELGF